MVRVPNGRGDPGREARLAAALKANLRRRKARTRALVDAETAHEPPQPGHADPGPEPRDEDPDHAGGG